LGPRQFAQNGICPLGPLFPDPLTKPRQPCQCMASHQFQWTALLSVSQVIERGAADVM
jgi:hypothetical protein